MVCISAVLELVTGPLHSIEIVRAYTDRQSFRKSLWKEFAIENTGMSRARICAKLKKYKLFEVRVLEPCLAGRERRTVSLAP